jgi:DNA-binding protein
MENQEQTPTAKPENVVYIGKKPTMNYVLAVVTQFNKGMQEVLIKARGNAISKAVDVEQIVTRKFIANLNKNIQTASEEVTGEDGTRFNVSTIRIVLGK